MPDLSAELSLWYSLHQFRLLPCRIAASVLLCLLPSSLLSTSLIKRLITGPGGWEIIRLGLYTCAHSDHSPSSSVWPISALNTSSLPLFLCYVPFSTSIAYFFARKTAEMGVKFGLPTTNDAVWTQVDSSGSLFLTLYFWQGSARYQRVMEW